MAVHTFDSTKEFLEELLKKVGDGRIRLPDFQRGWVWSHQGITGLLASVSLGYPVGTLMLLKTGGEARFQSRPIEGAEQTAVQDAEQLLLDGQQRMTSLFQALAMDGPVTTHDERGREMRGWFYIDIEAAVTEGFDREDAIRFVPENRTVVNFRNETLLDYSTPEAEYTAKVFPLARVFDVSDWADGFREHHEYDRDLCRLWSAFNTEVVKRFEKYQLPVIELGRETPREAVCQVFEKVNTGGVTLTVFELLTATFAADEFELRTDWAQRRRAWDDDTRYRVLGEVRDTDFLQIVALLATQERRRKWIADGGDRDKAPRIGCRRTEMLRLSLDEYRDWADPAVEGLLKAARYLYDECVYDTRFLPYGAQLIPLAAIFATLGTDADTHAARDRISRWFWCGVLGELYGGSTETRFARDLPETVAWVRGEGPPPRTVEDAQFVPSRLDTLRTRNSAAYKGIYALLLARDISDWRTGVNIKGDTYFDYAVDVHHVFPKAWCAGQGIEAEAYNSIVNKTPLSYRTNRAIGGQAPSQYLDRLTNATQSPVDVVEEHVRRHLIDVGTLREDDFPRFMAARRQALLELVGEAMGKQVAQTEA